MPNLNALSQALDDLNSLVTWLQYQAFAQAYWKSAAHTLIAQVTIDTDFRKTALEMTNSYLSDITAYDADNQPLPDPSQDPDRENDYEYDLSRLNTYTPLSELNADYEFIWQADQPPPLKTDFSKPLLPA